MTEPTFTPADLPASYRDAIAVAIAAHRHDAEGVAALWRGTPNRSALLYALSRLPSILATAVARGLDHDLDVEAALTGLVRRMPHDLADLDHGDPA